MKVGIVHIATAYTADIADFARKAEDVGFESLWLGEHTVVPASFMARYPTTSDGSPPGFVAHVCDPFVSLMRAATVTSTLRLGTAVCLLPEHNLFALTKQVATLDHYSDGRVLLGVGVGWLKEEGEIAGNWPSRYVLLGEMVQAMKALWTNDEAEFHGQLIDFPPSISMPHPKQQPHPPVLIGGGPANLDRVVAYGDGWCPGFLPPGELRRQLDSLRERMNRASRDFDALDISVMMGVGERSDIPAMLAQYEAAGAQRVVLCVNKPGTPDEFSDFRLVLPGESDDFLERLGDRIFR
jgi:probable F420-dependent oxidoreductase